MAKEIYTLTPQDVQIMDLARELAFDDDGRLVKCASFFTSFYFRSVDQPRGWEFDHNINPAWQLDCHHTPHSDIVVIGGMGSSKTSGIAMSAITYASLNDNFKFLNVAPTAWQSKQMYDYILSQSLGTLFDERFLFKNVEKPFPKITLKYRTPQGQTVISTLEFMSASDDARTILTWEGDWCNIDQAEMIDQLMDLWANLGTRTRGITRSGRRRLGRLSAIANADDNPELWYLADMAEDFPETNRFFSVSTFHNKNLDKEQIKSFERRLGNDANKIEQHMNAKRPMGKGIEFSAGLVKGCMDENLDTIMKHNLELGTPGFEQIIQREAGITTWQMPAEPDRTYIIVGDPGQGHAPYRNAPVVLVFDVTDYPDGPMVMRALWWGDGGGSYQGWINQFHFWMEYYRAYGGAYDATGGQKIHSETTFQHATNVWPLDMSNVKKRLFMVTLKLLMMKKMVKFPSEIKGLSYQLLKYKLPDEKIPQDLVSALFLLGGLIRALGYEVEEEPENTPESSLAPTLEDRYSRLRLNRLRRNNYQRS